jgi:uncharacterized protein (TIGR03790 family)
MGRAVLGVLLAVLLAVPAAAAAPPAPSAHPAPLAAPLSPTATYPLFDPFDYSDVLLLGNNNSPTSHNLTAHFAALHQVPASQVLYADLPDAESITEAQWGAFASWFTGEMANRSLGSNINYIVTFKGMPIRVYWSGGNLTSFQDALMLLGGNYESYIGSPGPIGRGNPYFNRTEAFTFAQFGFRLVTGIYAYNESTAMALIDRSANSLGSRGEFVLDADASKGYSNSHGTYGWANSALVWANDTLSARGLPTYLDTNNTYVTGRSNVIGYSSWGSNDCCWGSVTQLALPHNTWVNGSIGETFVSTGGRTFSWPPSYGQSLIADWIDEGATGMKGYTDEPYINAIADGHILYGHYSRGYNLAESYWAASHFIGWRQIVIGDPKMAPYADITDLSVNGTLLNVPSSAPQFGTLNLTLGIDNTGAVARDGEVRFDYGLQPLGTISISMPPHAAASYAVSLDLSGIPAGVWGVDNLTVTVDPLNSIQEWVEGNNALARPLEVRRAPIVLAALERGSVLTFEPVNLTLTAGRADRPIDHFEVSFDGGTAQAVPAIGNAAVFSTSFNRSGPHAFGAVAVDAAGLRSPPAEPLPLTVLNRRPTASLSANDTAPLSLVPVAFDAAASSDLDGTVANYFWDAGALGSGYGPQFVLEFPRPGTFAVALTITDDEGATDTASIQVEVSNRPPQPAVTANVTSTLTLVPVELLANASSDPDGAIVSWTFRFDDGTVDVASAPHDSHVFLRPGDLGLWLEVTDDWGATARVHISIQVANRAPIMAWETPPPAAVAEGSSVAFGATAQDLDGSLDSYTLDFGDGRRSTGTASGPIRATHSYDSEGNYTVTLRLVDDLGAVATLTASVAVLHPAPVVSGSTVELNGTDLTVNYLVVSPYSTLEILVELDGTLVVRQAAGAEGTLRAVLPESAPGNHTLRVSVTDGTKSTVVETRAFEVQAPPAGGPPAPPTSEPTVEPAPGMLVVAALAVVAAAAVAALAILVRRRRSQ